MEADPWKAPCQDIQRHPAVAHAEVLCRQSKWEHQPGEEKQWLWVKTKRSPGERQNSW